MVEKQNGDCYKFGDGGIFWNLLFDIYDLQLVHHYEY